MTETRITEPRINFVIVTLDAGFGTLCDRLFATCPALNCLVVVAPREALVIARQHVLDFILFDIDGQESAETIRLAATLALITTARLILATAYLGPGSPGLGALLQSTAAAAVLKPQGSSSLSLAGDANAGPAFVASVQSAFELQSPGQPAAGSTHPWVSHA